QSIIRHENCNVPRQSVIRKGIERLSISDLLCCTSSDVFWVVCLDLCKESSFDCFFPQYVERVTMQEQIIAPYTLWHTNSGHSDDKTEQSHYS
ncbi:MAG TPA: hypothetical protein PLQ21_02085, partial [Candidatus Kapabacteria bacterium]|nr:hypothetical protein [Candidatus Kapabacteria bacterium]